jgi:pimeloyl-ACP methyl ester carboxylesterase
MVAGDPRRELDLSCRTLVLWGARDAQLPLDDAFEYARRLRAPLRVVADCGHLVIVERPRAVVDALTALA